MGNLCGDFAGGPPVPTETVQGQPALGGQAQPCQKVCCRTPGEELAEASDCPAGAEGFGDGVLSALHRVVHPGCTCEHDDVGHDTSTPKEGSLSCHRNQRSPTSSCSRQKR